MYYYVSISETRDSKFPDLVAGRTFTDAKYE